jgi:hypothetical protein
MDQDSKQTVPVEKIIALKRYEQPPPGYFQLLPGRIISRIEHGEGQSAFWEKWRLALRIRPAAAYALGLAACAALIAGLYCLPTMQQTAGLGESASSSLWADTSAADSASQDAPLSGSRWLGSTNPVTAPQTGDSLFPAAEARAMPVSLFEAN